MFGPSGSLIFRYMKKCWLMILICCFVSPAYGQQYPRSDKTYIQHGELLTYKISYGFLTIGEATITTSEHVYRLGEEACYKVDISGRTTGAVGWVARVDDKWGAYLRKTDLLPLKGYRIVRENNYKRDETTFFDHQEKQIRYLRYDHKAQKYQEAQLFTFTETVRDLIGAYHYLRQLDYDQMSKGDTIRVAGFFEDEFYHFKVLYQGREKIKTEFGSVKALKLVPVMPNNKVFDGENSISLWLSDDDNRIPLKAEANMFIGKAGCDIISYTNLKSNLGIARK